jgi:hypothetical protein
VLVDRDEAIPAARTHLDMAGVGDRVECVVNDFFGVLPAGLTATCCRA